jgi:hypothetical protein
MSYLRHGRVLPTISYMTFLDVYCVSSIMIVFSAMVWHAAYLVIYKQDEALAERFDLYAMMVFAVVVFIVHIVQTIWFVIAIQKRIHLEKLDKKAALNYMKARMSVSSVSNQRDMYSASLPIVSDHPGHQMSATSQTNNIGSASLTPRKQSNKQGVMSNDTSFNQQQPQPAPTKLSNVKSKRMLYSLSKMEDNSIITVHNSEDYTNSRSAPPPPPPPDDINSTNTYEPEKSLLIGMPSPMGVQTNKTARNETYSSACSNTNQSHNRSHTPTNYSNHGQGHTNHKNSADSSNLLLISKSNSFTNSQNMALANLAAGGSHRDYLSNTIHGSGSLSHHKKVSSSSQHQQHHPPCSKAKNKNHHYYDVNRLNVAGNASQSLDYQHLPLLRQSSRDS